MNVTFAASRNIYILQESTAFSPVLKDTCAPPAVMNSMFPRCKMPANSLKTSRTSSLLNCITSIAVWNDTWASSITCTLTQKWGQGQTCQLCCQALERQVRTKIGLAGVNSFGFIPNQTHHNTSQGQLGTCKCHSSFKKSPSDAVRIL